MGVFDPLRSQREKLRRLQAALAAVERELAGEREQLEAAVRRGRLAAQIPDAETVAVAERFAARHRERIALLERKLAVQRDELHLAERDLAELASVEPAANDTDPHSSAERDTEFLRLQAERRRLEATIEQQLAHLKRKLGKQ